MHSRSRAQRFSRQKVGTSGVGRGVVWRLLAGRKPRAGPLCRQARRLCTCSSSASSSTPSSSRARQCSMTPSRAGRRRTQSRGYSGRAIRAVV